MTDQHDANCSPETIASFFRMIQDTHEEEQRILEKRDNLMRMLALEAGATFMYEGQIYQVCERHNKARGMKVPFFKKLKAWPKSWLDKEARSKRGLSQEEAAPVDESAQVDVMVGQRGDRPSSDPMPLNTVEAEALDAGATPTAVVID